MKELHINRPGAIGDIIMTLQAIYKYKQINPDVKIIYYCDPVWRELPLICSAVDEWRDSAIWCGDGQNYKNLYGYTETPLKHHLMWYFGKELGLIDAFDVYGFRPVFKTPIEHANNIITIHPFAGWSPYKNWNIKNWQEVINHIKSGYTVIQIGNKTDYPLDYVVDARGKLSIVESIQLIKKAVLHLGVDSFSNHATALLPLTPSVILWGSTHPMIFGYGHNINIWKPLQCSPCYRIYDWITKNPTGKCPLDKLQSWENPEHPCMSHITVDEVLNAISKLLKDK